MRTQTERRVPLDKREGSVKDKNIPEQCQRDLFLQILEEVRRRRERDWEGAPDGMLLLPGGTDECVRPHVIRSYPVGDEWSGNRGPNQSGN